MPVRQSWRLMVEVFAFLRHNRRWWLLPIIVFIILCSLLIVTIPNSPLAPIIYTIF